LKYVVIYKGARIEVEQNNIRDVIWYMVSHYPIRNLKELMIIGRKQDE